MLLTKKELKFLFPFLLFVLIGISGIYSFNFLTGSLSMEKTFRWCGIPVLFISVYYGYRSTFGYENSNTILKNIIACTIMTVIVSAIVFISFQGILIRINALLGSQQEYELSGRIVNIDYPEQKKAGNKYSIEIARTKEQDTIKLDVPTNEYRIGQNFRKKMKIGSLGFIYSEN